MEFNQVAHDLMQPLKSMEGLIDILKDTKNKEEEQKIICWLEECTKKFEKIIIAGKEKTSKEKQQDLKNQYNNRVLLKNIKQIKAFDLGNLAYIIGSGNYSNLYLINNKLYTFCILIGKLETELLPNGFFRIRKNTIINVKHMKSYDEINYLVTMKTSEEFEVSRRRVEDFEVFLSQLF